MNVEQVSKSPLWSPTLRSEKVGKLQTALHTKAKNSPGYRFYALYDKLYRRDILQWAFVRCRHNGGAPELDDQSLADIKAYGEDQWLDELTEELRNETYRPRPVRRVFIPKGVTESHADSRDACSAVAPAAAPHEWPRCGTAR